MKIELKLDNDSIIHVTELIKNVYTTDQALGKENKMLKSIAYDLADKFEGKYKTLIKKQCLFSNKNKTKVTLKWHEAWALETLLHYLMDLAPSSFAKIKLNQVISQLNQKLV